MYNKKRERKNKNFFPVFIIDSLSLSLIPNNHEVHIHTIQYYNNIELITNTDIYYEYIII